jgi:hypothetical protein
MTENKNKRPTSSKFFRVECRPLNPGAPKSLKEILEKLYAIPDFDRRVLVSRESNKTLTSYRLRQIAIENIFTFHFLKINGDSNELILDLKSGNSTRISDEISGIGADKGILKHLSCDYDYKMGILAWQSANSPTIEDFRFFVETIFGTKIRFLPVKDPKAAEFFRLMSPERLEVEISLPSTQAALSLVNLDPNAKISKYQELMNDFDATKLSVTLSMNQSDGKKSLNKNLIQDETNLLRKLIEFSTGRRRMSVIGEVIDNGIIEKKMIDLIDGLMFFPWEIGEFSDVLKLWEYKEVNSINAINQMRKDFPSEDI